MLFRSAPAKAQVTGVVRDAAGNPMIGVTVTIKGTLVGVSTGVDGSYTIPADKDAMLLFSYIGYRNQEEPVGQRTQIDVTMQEDQLVMDEVVVVGYGTLKKRNIVGAVENLAGDAVENRPNADITRSLQGQIPGLNIVQTDGKAAHGGQVTIRGVNNSFKARVNDGQKENKLGQGGSALVLIDGAEGDMSSVNPDDIASISVLKDASSAAVYGARGAFGVILITTKNPEKGKVRVNYNGSVSLHRRTVIWEDNVVTDPVQWVEAFRESYLNSSPTATVPSLFNNYMPYSNAWFEELKRRRADPTMDNYSIDANGNYSYYGETNWLKEIYKSVNYSTTHAVSIQGGREGVSYYVSGRYYNQDGRSKAQFLTNAVLHYINCTEAPELHIPTVPDKKFLEEQILAILAEHSWHVEKNTVELQIQANHEPECKDASLINTADLEQWFGGQDGMSTILNSLQMFEQN